MSDGKTSTLRLVPIPHLTIATLNALLDGAEAIWVAPSDHTAIGNLLVAEQQGRYQPGRDEPVRFFTAADVPVYSVPRFVEGYAVVRRGRVA